MKVRPAIDPLGGWVIKHQRMFFFCFADSEVRVCAIMTHQNGLDIVGSPAPGSCTVRFYSWQDSSKETVAGSPEAGRIRAPFVRI